MAIPEYVQPLLRLLLDWLHYLLTPENIQGLYDFIRRNSWFKKAARKAKVCGKAGLRLLKNMKAEILKELKQNQALIVALGKLTFKSIATNSGGLGFVVNGTQALMEVAGYKEEAKAVSLVGNVTTGACAGFMVGGPVGAGIGALTSLGSWIIAESADNALDATLSD